MPAHFALARRLGGVALSLALMAQMAPANADDVLAAAAAAFDGSIVPLAAAMPIRVRSGYALACDIRARAASADTEGGGPRRGAGPRSSNAMAVRSITWRSPRTGC